MVVPMHDFFSDSFGVAAFRSFFALATATDLIFIYSMVFDRDLSRRIAVRFFSALSGMPVSMRPTDETVRWWQWLGFVFVSAVPPALWLLFEFYHSKYAT
jgi:hypothetical protein